MSNRYWVYVNEPNNKALVHLASCSYCNDGQGLADDKLDYNGQWLGPFVKEEAERRAQNSGKKTRRWCGFCAKMLGINTELDTQ